MDQQQQSVRLRVGDAKLEDAGESRARLSRQVFKAMRLKEGDVVLITGTGHVLSAALPGGPEDDGLDLIRLDGTQRRKLGVEVGGTVEVQRYDARAAERVRLLTIGDSRSVELSPNEIRGTLAEQAITVGDTFAVSPRRRDFQAEVSLLGLRLVEVTGSSAGPHAVMVRVVETAPPGVVRITDETEIELVPPDGSAALEDDEGWREP